MLGSLCVFKVWAHVWFHPESQDLPLCEDGILQAKREQAALEEAASQHGASPRIR